VEGEEQLTNIKIRQGKTAIESDKAAAETSRSSLVIVRSFIALEYFSYTRDGRENVYLTIWRRMYIYIQKISKPLKFPIMGGFNVR
jgi:hypothetical protein